MKYRNSFSTFGIAILALLGLLHVIPIRSVETAKEKDVVAALPHIVMIVLDDMGSHDLGLHGTGIQTPNLDGFVSSNNSGIYLENYYVLPYCSPTRAALLSGMYPLRTGVHNVIEYRSTAGLPLDLETLPELLRRASYETHAVGKWHVGHSSWKQTPTFRGFDSFFGFYMGGQDYFTHEGWGGGVDMHWDKRANCGENCSMVVNERGNYSTHVFTREAIRVVEDYANRNALDKTATHDATKNAVDNSTRTPLFLYLAYQAVHCPNEVPQGYIDPYQNNIDWTDQRKNYAGMLTAADEGIGNLTKMLKKYGLWENTLVIATTDNGGPTTVGCSQGSSNYPKRGGKCTLWEGGTTGDALLAGPALPNLLERTKNLATPKHTSKASSVNPRFKHLFHVVDWLPTLAEWVGIIPQNKSSMDGVSQATALAQNNNDKIGSPARTELFGGYAYLHDCDHSNKRWWGPSIRHLNWKLIQGSSGGSDDNDPLPPGSETIVPPGDNGSNATGYLLFDLEKDPGEENDLSKAFPEILEKMIQKLKLYRKYFVYPQINDDSNCPFPGLVNTSIVGPAWLPWCNSDLLSKTNKRLDSIA